MHSEPRRVLTLGIPRWKAQSCGRGPRAGNANFHTTAHSKVSLATTADREFWCDYFGTDAAELNAAISAVGSYLVSIEDHLSSLQQKQSVA